uniref:Uncharacterized protein n=1 Tax=Oryza punctata TaxID=4537 RepID=A0A0E0LME8_ORYPU
MDSRPRETDAPAEPSGGAAPLAAAAAAAKGEVEITKPRNDKRGYRRVVLPNALECLVISDPDTDKAAASMNVSVGYFCDPEGLPGLAHFLEHMLFYASEKYPIEDSYSKYIAEHGGSRNAFTSRESTNFFFDVNNDCLDDALDRFAQFFINPLISPDAVLREVNAVDSENQKNLLTDLWRMSQLQKHICSESHPYHKFSTGNRNTLVVNPNKNGLDTLDELIKFYGSHYSANLMQLVVYGKESLDNLQTLVENKFSDVRNTGRKRFSFHGHPCSSEHLQVLVKAVPIKQGHTLRILWPITPNIQHYKEGPCKYVSHLVGHEGEGSLFYVLKKLGWAMSLRAREGDRSSEFSFFRVVIRLTDVGHEHMEDIIGLLFRYIALLQTSGTPKWIFDELLAIRETGFHYRDKSPPSHYVVNISSNMQIFPPEDWLIASSVPSKFSPDAIQSILNDLTPNNVRIFWESKKFEGQTNLLEPWYGTSYSVEAVPPSIIQNWVNRAPMEDLHMPKPNIFTPSDLSLKNVEEKGSFPCMLRKTLFSRVWYKPDTMFFTPKAYIKMYFHCPLSPYDAQVAGLFYVVKPNDTGFQITMVGYNDKMRTLLETVIGKIAAFEVKVDRFVVIKETITKEYENFKFRQPHQQALYYCSLILEEQTWTWDEELAAISHTEASDLEKFWPHLLGKTFIESYFAGNMEPGEVKGIIQHVEDILFNAPVSLCKALPSSQHLTKRIVKLERGLRYYYPALCLNHQDENSSLLHYIQIHQDDLKQNVLLQLLGLVAKQPAFHQLRSVEQLGYIARLRQRNDSGVHGLQFTIQSTVKDPANLDARVEAFLKMFEGTLYQMPDTEFKSNVDALIDMKLEKYKNIREESAFFWREISKGTLKFDRKEAEVAALRDLKKEELIEFFNNHVKVNAPQKKILSIQVYGGLHTSEYEKIVHDEPQPHSYQITDIFSFRRSTSPTSLAVSPCQPNPTQPPGLGLADSTGGASAAADAMDSRPRETDAPAEPSDGAVAPPAAAAAKGDVEITRPRNDKRGYRRVVLPNDLECLLVSDPDTDKAAASMNVSVGYFCDPEGLEGLAHFLEHMLFYASEKYPIEDSYSKYITEHGGSTNAFTTCEHTNFFFDVNSDCLNDALDRFAQFFIKPLLSADATLREIKAVDSENQKNLLSDPWRMNQLQNHISLESHPYHKFGTGNWDTLEVKPKEKGLDTRLELIKFYDSHYSANLMQLVVYGKESLDNLQTLVENKFYGVRNTGRERFSFPGHPCSSEHLQVLVKAVPIKQGHTLRILWPITPNIRHYKEGPCKYVSHLIGHEGEGSLFYVLKKLGWAMSLEAGEGDWSYEFSFFSVVIKLTDVGHEHMEDIVGLLFRYITLLQTSGTPKWIFDELQTICETGFHYRDKSPPIHYVANISSNMQIYPPEDWLIASSVPSKFSPDAIQGILNELTPDNVRIFWESKKFEGQTNLTEPWYGTSYSLEAVPPSIIQKWVEKAPVEDLHMPKPNIFIPSDLSLKNAEKASFPCMLRKTLFSRVWYKPDTMFFTPKAYIKMDFHCPLSHSSPESTVLTDVFTRLLMDYLNDYAYDAQVAGLYYGVWPNDTGFQITMVGYNDKMRTLLETVIGKIAEFGVKADRFSVIKETITKEYENFKFRQPYQQAFYYCSLILEEQTWAWDEELAAVSHIEARNMEPGAVKGVMQHVEDILFNAPVSLCKALPSSQHLTKRIVKLERGLRYYYPALCLNHQDENSCLLHYIQIHQDDLKKNVLLQLLALVAKQPAFHQLRSVEQLGYITLLRQKNDSGVRGLQFIIQSTVKDPANLDVRVEAFLTMFEGTLYEMPDTEFKSNVNALIDMKLEKYKNIREESAFFWGEISEGTLKFDRKEAEVAALRDLKKEELIEFFNNHVKVNAPQKKILSIQVYGGLHSSEYEKIVHGEPQPNSYQITDIFSFRSGGESVAAAAMADSRPARETTDAPAEPSSDGAIAAAPSAAAKGDAEITRPRNDKRGYRRVVLPNALECLLVSDPDTDKAAASMNVSVGYFCDPAGLPGLAHFLEHMLFYASEKYPMEDDYSKYIAEHGGSTNAFTSRERTNFFFDVNNSCLDDALDRFAQFFIKPLMSSDATLREINAVDSENKKNLLSDPWRMSQLQKHFCSEIHPYHKFSTGNRDTLLVNPNKEGLDTLDELIKFYNSHYSANLMQLVVYGKESLDNLQTLVENKFSDVRNNGRERFSFHGHPCSTEHLQILVKAVPIKEGHTLRILWPITPNIQHYKEGPCKYVSHLVGHEGEGSLFYVLKNLGWAMSLEAWEGDWSYEFSFFNVVIRLTDVGHEHMEDIIGLLFRYITLLQNSGTPKWIFDELLAICETGFHYHDKSPPIHYVVNISSNMQIFPPEDWLIASSVPSKFSPDAIQSILNDLTPDNVRIFWESKKFEGQTNLTEPWYGTSYSVEAVPPSIIQKWVNRAPMEDLHMPKPNIFIPSDLSLKNIKEKGSFPCMLRKTLFSRLWYKPDTVFFTPKAYVKMDFHCPLSCSSPESTVLTDMFTRLIMDYLNDFAYDAQVAGLYYTVRPNDTGFQITMVGYNDKMRTLLDTVIGKIAEFEVKVDRFAVIKETIMKDYENFKFRQPYEQAFYYCSLILVEQTWAWDEKLVAVSRIEASDLQNFLPHLLSKTFIECYFAGNMEPSEAKDVMQHVEDTLFNAPISFYKALPPSQHLTKRIVKLERGLRYYYPALCLNHQDEKNSSLLHYIQIHQDDLKQNVLLQLLALVAKQPAFHQLRSVEQLGYITVLTQRNDSGVRGLQFIIQSTVKDPSNLDDRVEAFLNMFEGTLYQMPDEEFKSNVNALIDMKLEKYKNIREESAFFWKEISEGTLKFDRKEAEVAALRDLNKEDLIEFFNNHVKVNAPQKKILSIQVYGGLHSSEYEKIVHDERQPHSYQITDIFSFRRSRPLYGSFKGGVGQMKL